jgi:hypothetical protein
MGKIPQSPYSHEASPPGKGGATFTYGKYKGGLISGAPVDPSVTQYLTKTQEKLNPQTPLNVAHGTKRTR